MILSILTPAVPSRFRKLETLCAHIGRQIPHATAVEHLVLIDNKARTVGEKRDALLRCARGYYVAFVDDDDWVSDDYVNSILAASIPGPGGTAPDVITFNQLSTIDGHDGAIEFGLGNPNEPFLADGVAKRNAWHVCAWRRTLAIQSHFPAVNYGEDWAFAAPLCAIPNLKSVHVPKILHHYRYDSKTSEAPPGS